MKKELTVKTKKFRKEEIVSLATVHKSNIQDNYKKNHLTEGIELIMSY